MGDQSLRLGEYMKALLVKEWGYTPIPGYVDVVVHGTAKSLSKTSIYEVTNNLARQGLDGNPIRLCACNAGALRNGIAQELATATGQRVIAPTGYLHIFKNGRHSIQSFKQGLRQWRPSTGSWKGFYPK